MFMGIRLGLNMIDATTIIDYTHDEFVRGIKSIAKQIKDSGWKPDLIVGVVRGGSIPATYLSHILKTPVQMVHWSSRDSSAFGGNETNAWIPEEINLGTQVLLVDDIVDGGETIKQILADWQLSVRRRLCTENIKIASLFYNTEQDVAVDYFDRSINRSEDARWVTFDWECC